MFDHKSLLKRLVESESPSADKAAVDRLAAIVAEQARSLGAQVQSVPESRAGDHLIARFTPPGGGEGGVEAILLLCHMDTVFPLGTLEHMPYREEGERIRGPGVLDMKAGIVIALAALAELGTDLRRPVTLLCTSDEEVGSPTARKVIEGMAQESDLVLVLEPARPDGALKTWRKGVGRFELRAHGRAAHAGGAHAEGVNAIEEMAHQVLAIQKMTDYEDGITFNVGVLHGGTVSNVVPELAVARVDVRVQQPGQWEQVHAAMLALRPALEGASLEVHGELNRPPMPFDERAQSTFARAQAIAAGIGMQLVAGGSGGGSDANFVAALGIPVLDGLGATGEGLHSEREYILADSLSQRTRLLAALLQEW